ncbi:MULTISPECIES: helix-turn-helix domain-containing protein [Nocardia]|uniref:helix-turn-helix domain-containing protein n=1 Tax=Nocardia TaxID=1817 RepID=UPI000D690B53|nr:MULTISPECIES: helix-turn-helix transcriptional regulator [Nocardia]
MKPDSEPPPSLPRRRFGQRIREARLAANLNLKDVAQVMQWSGPTQSRIEHGKLGTLKPRDVKLLCDAVGISDTREVEALTSYLEEATAQPRKWWQQQYNEVIPEHLDVYVGLEFEATEITIYRAELMPGLFQTRDYAAAINQLFFPHDSEEQQRRRVDFKIQRQASLTRKVKPLKVTMVLDEAVVRRVVGGKRVMAAQLDHLAEMSKRPNITIQVLPFEAGYPVGAATGAYTILSLVDANPVVYAESFTSNIYLEEDADVAQYRSASVTIHRAALDAMASRSLLRRAAKELTT